MKKALFGVAVCASLLALAGMASAQLTSINQIQTYTGPLGTAAPNPVVGTVVTVEGTLFVVKGQFNTGAHYIQGVDGGIQCFLSSAPIGVNGDKVQVTGTVATFSGEIEIATTSYTFISHPGEPAPIAKTIPSLAHWAGAPPKVYDYESVGSFIEVTGTIATAPTNNIPTSDKQFGIAAGGDTLIVFVSKNTGIDVGAVAVGDQFRVRGACVKFNALVELKPRSQADLVEGTGPVITSVKSSNYHPLSTTPLAISANIAGQGLNTIAGATLFYRNSAGDSLGAYSSVAMSGSAGVYTASIPTPHSGIRVDYYISAVDNLSQTTLSPASAPTSHNELAVGYTTIHDIQFVDPNAAVQDSPKKGKVVNGQGIVTYATGEAGAVSKFILEDAAGGPFSGVLVYDGTGSYGSVFTGDKVQVGGHIDEFLGMTEFVPFAKPGTVPEGDAAAPVTVVSFGNALPKAQYVRTRVLGDHVLTDGNGFLGEAYEAVRVRTLASLVLADTAGRRFTITDTGADADTVQVIPFIQLTYHGIPGDHVIVEGFIDDNGKYMLRPVADEAIVSGLTGVGDTTPQLQPAGGFIGVSPNPFNPKTEIRFALTRPNLVQLNVYNIRGELVRTLVNGRLDAGSHPVVWDGKNDSGRTMSSGVYFARLRIGLEVTQIEKLSLVK